MTHCDRCHRRVHITTGLGIGAAPVEHLCDWCFGAVVREARRWWRRMWDSIIGPREGLEGGAE